MLLKIFRLAEETGAARAGIRSVAMVLCVASLAACENLSELGSELRRTYDETLLSLDKSLNNNDLLSNGLTAKEQREIVTLDRPAVRRLQVRLAKLGFRPGPADGILGSRTVTAINSYQSRFALTVTASISRGFLNHLETMTEGKLAGPPLSPLRQQSGLPDSPINLASDDFPTYLPGTSFIYSNGETERVLGEKDFVVRWARGDGTTYSTHRNFLLPKSYWTSGSERGTVTTSGTPDELWPFREGSEISFSAKVTMQNGNDPDSTERRVDLWRCRNDGSRMVTVKAGTFETLLLVCSRGENPAAPDLVRTWYYSKAVRHYVRFVETDPGSDTIKSADLVAIRPGALNWPPIVRAALARALIHALEMPNDSSQMPWTSSGVNTHVTIEAKSRFIDNDGRQCRRFEQIWSENGHRRHYPAAACKTTAGKWTIPGLEGGSATSIATSGDVS